MKRTEAETRADRRDPLPKPLNAARAVRAGLYNAKPLSERRLGNNGVTRRAYSVFSGFVALF